MSDKKITREEAVRTCISFSNRVADTRWVHNIFDKHEAEVEKFKQEIEELKEYKFMYEGLCK